MILSLLSTNLGTSRLIARHGNTARSVVDTNRPLSFHTLALAFAIDNNLSKDKVGGRPEKGKEEGRAF